MRIIWDFVVTCSKLDEHIEDNEGQIHYGLYYFEKTIKESIHGHTSNPHECRYVVFAVDSFINRLFPMILPSDLLLMAYLLITFQWKAANTLHKAYKVFRIINRYRMTDADVSSVLYNFNAKINNLEKEETNK